MQPEPTEVRPTPPTRLPLFLAIALTIGGVILLAVFAYLLYSDGEPDDPAVGGATPTPFPLTTPVRPLRDVLVVGISGNERISVTLDIPLGLTVAGQSFALESQPPVLTAGVWEPTIAGDGRGVWIYGSVVNYVIGLPDSTQNRALLQSLAPGAPMMLRTESNNTLEFSFDSREIVAATSRDIYTQLTPGVTIVLVGSGGGERLIVHGRYVVADSVANPSPGGGAVSGQVTLGETALLGDAQLAVTGATYLFDRPEAPPGFAFYLIDFELTNVGQAPLPANQLRLTLSDEVGNQYALNPAAGQLGNFPPLAGAVLPGDTVQASAGYQVPSGLQSVALRWQVTRLDDGSQILVLIPFNDGGSGDEATTNVLLQQAEVSLDGTSLLLNGQITNFGSQPVVVTEQDVALNSAGTIFLILSTNPGFPWVISPGQTLPYSVTFQRPAGGTATFQVLNQPFQLDGLR